jgi:lysozyme family protein
MCKIKKEYYMETSTESSFKRAFRLIIEGYEGNYSNDKDDPGGETYKGISRNMNKDFDGWKIIDSYKGKKNYPELLKTDDKLQSLVLDFYKKNYWDAFEGDILGEETGEEMFDQSINLGIERASEHLQRSLNILNDRQTLYPDIKVDGVIGDQTIGAYFKCCSMEKEKMLVNVLNMFQAKYYIELMEKRNAFEKFIGLFKRVTII